MKTTKENEIIILKTKDGPAVDVQINNETAWLNQNQMTDLFEKDQSVISRHLNNIFKEKELARKSNMQKMHIPNSDKPVNFYSLDVIISVGYRVKSKRGTQFRAWANKILKEFLLEGYAVNQSKLKGQSQKIKQLETTIKSIVEAFRHAYASGIFTQVYNRRTANLLGWYNEYKGTNPIKVQNMDLWNNSIGRKYGEKTSSRTELSQLLVKALEEELIIDPKDPREYKGLKHFDYDPEKPVEVIDETETGLNNTFFDLSNGTFMKRKEFIAEIKSGNYKGYQIVQKGNLEFPISKPDKVTSNNLG